MKRSGGRKCAGGISDEGQGLGNAQLRAATATLYFILLNMMTHAASARNCKPLWLVNPGVFAICPHSAH